MKNIATEKIELQRFGVMFSIALLLWGGYFLIYKETLHLYFFIFSGVFLFLGLFYPILLKPVHKISVILLNALNPLAMVVAAAILFYLVITPTCVLARLFGKKFLELKFEDGKDSFWIPKENSQFMREKYKRQF